MQPSFTKYSPNQVRSDSTENGETFSVTINSHGFRGKEFQLRKPPRVIRVVMLGASSTFGYGDKDHETYPHYLEELLNERLRSHECHDAASFEVINMGIPHMWSGNIHALLMAEGIPLKPDVVTVYAGMNDSKQSGSLRDRPNEYKLVSNAGDGRQVTSWLYTKVIKKLRNRLILAALLDNLITINYETYPAHILEEYSKHKIEEFIDNLSAIGREAKKAGALFIVANQQAHSDQRWKKPKRGTTYNDEVVLLSERLRAGDAMSYSELVFLTHSKLMDQLKRWVLENDVPFADVIEALDMRRDLLISYVHLSPTANKIVATVFGDIIFNRMCVSASKTSS